MDEEKLTNDELVILEKALRHYHSVVRQIPNYYDFSDEYATEIRCLAQKLRKIHGYDFDVWD